MKTIQTIVLMALATAPLMGADFELRVTTDTPQIPPFGAVQFRYVLKNNGPQRHIPIGAGRINEYLFVFVRFQNEPEVTWRDPTIPQASFTRPPREFFGPGQEITNVVTVFWHTNMPVFARVGQYTVRMSWRGPEEDIFSDPVTITVAPPQGQDLQALEILKSAQAVEAIAPPYWRKQGSEKPAQAAEPGNAESPAQRAIREVESRFPGSQYVKMLRAARENAERERQAIEERRRLPRPAPKQ